MPRQKAKNLLSDCDYWDNFRRKKGEDYRRWSVPDHQNGNVVFVEWKSLKKLRKVDTCFITEISKVVLFKMKDKQLYILFGQIICVQKHPSFSQFSEKVDVFLQKYDQPYPENNGTFGFSKGGKCFRTDYKRSNSVPMTQIFRTNYTKIAVFFSEK